MAFSFTCLPRWMLRYSFFLSTASLCNALDQPHTQSRGRIDPRDRAWFLLFHCSATKSCLTLWLYGLQQVRFPCPSLSPRVCSNSRPFSWWCCLTISSSVAPFSCPQSFPASESFPVSCSLYQVGKGLEFQLQHQSFQWIFRIDFL